MTIDGRRPRGSYRCGCGVRVQVTDVAHPANRRPCWWNGCRTIAVTPEPVAFCEAHLGETLHQMAGPAGHRALWSHATQRYVREHPPESLPPQRRVETPKPWVYFMRREILIKIGYSVNPVARATQLGGATILATTPGGSAEEAALHRRFADLWVKGEWFHPGSALVDHINAIREAADQVPITALPELLDS